MSTIAAWLHKAAQQLDNASEARQLLCQTLNKDPAWLYAWPEHRLTREQLERLDTLLARRVNGEPLAYLTGQREFWSLPIQVSPATLIPRPETELLVELALERIQPGARVADLGTGSGCIALAIASECPDCAIDAGELSANALTLAQANARRLGLTNIAFHLGHWFAALPATHRYQVIVSNPPYVAANDPHLLQDGLPHEPQQALVSGADGLEALRHIIAGAPARLFAGGWLLVEHGWNQGQAVRQLFAQAGFSRIDTHPDLAGQDRVTRGCYPHAHE